MEVHAAPAVGKRLWSYVRAALFMARNGKRKLLLSMHLLGANNRRRGTKLAAVANLLTHHGHHANAYALRRRDYEFSCSNSPAVASSSGSSRPRLAYFPCVGAVAKEEEEEYEYRYQQYDDVAPVPGEEQEEEEYVCASASASASPVLLLPGAASGEFSVRVSNFSSDDEAAGAGSDGAVDADAEEFIRRFYDQLRRQNTVALLPYHMQQETIAAA